VFFWFDFCCSCIIALGLHNYILPYRHTFPVPLPATLTLMLGQIIIDIQHLPCVHKVLCFIRSQKLQPKKKKKKKKKRETVGFVLSEYPSFHGRLS